MKFQKGRAKTGGRKVGTPDKITKELKDMILGVLDEAGGQKYLVARALDQPVAFMAVVGKILPLIISMKPKPPEEVTDDELAAYVRALEGYLTRAGVDPELIAAAGRDELGTTPSLLEEQSQSGSLDPPVIHRR